MTAVTCRRCHRKAVKLTRRIRRTEDALEDAEHHLRTLAFGMRPSEQRREKERIVELEATLRALRDPTVDQ